MTPVGVSSASLATRKQLTSLATSWFDWPSGGRCRLIHRRRSEKTRRRRLKIATVCVLAVVAGSVLTAQPPPPAQIAAHEFVLVNQPASVGGTHRLERQHKAPTLIEPLLGPGA